MDAAEDPGLAEGVHLHGLIVVAAVKEVEAIALAAVLRGRALVEHEKGVHAAGGAAHPGFHDVAPGGQGESGLLHLPRPGAVEAGDGPGRVRQIQLHAEEPVHFQVFRGEIPEPRAAADHVAVGIDVIMQLQLLPILPVPEPDREMLHPAAFVIGAGEDGIGRLRVRDLRARIKEVRGPASVMVHQLDKGLPDVPLAAGGELQAHVLQIHGRVLRVIGKDRAGREAAFFRQGHELLGGGCAQPGPVMQVLQVERGQHAEGIACVFRFQQEKGPVPVKAADHAFPSRRARTWAAIWATFSSVSL